MKIIDFVILSILLIIITLIIYYNLKSKSSKKNKCSSCPYKNNCNKKSKHENHTL